MIHHLTLGTNDVKRARLFYDPIMDLVGLRRLKVNEGGVHYGTGEILFSLVTATNGHPATAGNGTHVAFQARDHAMVRKFYELAMENGVPIIENKPLAQALFKDVSVDRPIPEDRYAAVAEILKYVYQLKGKKIA